MDERKDESKEQKKDNKKNHKKLKIALTISLCSVLVLLTGVYLLFFFTHKDSNRNPNIKGEMNNTQIIEKNLIEGFSTTKDTGRYTFRLPQDDLNQILLNSSSDLLLGKEESIYIDSSSLTFYVDFKPILGVPTRVGYTFKNFGVNPSKEHVYILEDVPKMGKLPYMWGHRFNFEDFMKEVSKRSNLPLTWDNAVLTASPVKLLEYYPDEGVRNILSELIKAKPECLIIDPNSLFGFDIDLSKFKSATIPSREMSQTLLNLEDQVKSSLTSEFLSSIPIGESKVATSLSIKDINKHFDIKLDSPTRKIYLEDVYIYLKDNEHISYVVDTSFNGYILSFEVNSLITSLPKKMTLQSELPFEVYLNGIKFDKDSFIGSDVISNFFTYLDKVSEKYKYIVFNRSNTCLSIDLSYLSSEVTDFEDFKGQLIPNLSEPQGFDVLVTHI